MGACKNYIMELASLGETIEAADAIEWAALSRWVPITHDLVEDKITIEKQLPEILEAFRRVARENDMEEQAH